MLLWSRQRTKLSHQTIYNFIWEDYERRGEIWKCLRYCGKGRHCRRYKRGPGTSRRVRRSTKCIENRAEHIEQRLRYGHWEMDLIEGVGRKRPLLVLLERKSRYVTAGFLNGKWAEDVARVGRRLLCDLKVVTITSDNGPEFLNFELLEKAFNCPVYYTHSYASWEKGSVENVNGLLRQYFPKGTAFTMCSQSEARLACQRINSRPRKILNKRTPESLRKHLVINT
jgi:IS30 family transposase